MKQALLITLFFVTLISCKEEVTIKYPRYSLETVEYIPDSLKTEHRKWITETVRAASEHMTGGDYEDIDQTIRQAKTTADEIYGEKVVGLRKQIDDSYFSDVLITPDKMTPEELKLFNSLK